MGKVIGILNQKGGSAKSTSCQNLAVAMSMRGYSVLIIDTDEQKTSMKWYEMRAKTHPNPSVISIDTAAALQGNIATLSKAYDLVFIDGAAGVNALTSASIKICELVIVPVQPTLKDYQSTSETATMIRRRQEVSDGVPKAVFLMTRTKPRQKITRDFAEVLLDLGLPVLDSQLVERSAYATADLVAKSVVEYKPKSDAAADIHAIINELIQEELL